MTALTAEHSIAAQIRYGATVLRINLDAEYTRISRAPWTTYAAGKAAAAVYFPCIDRAHGLAGHFTGWNDPEARA